MGQSLIDFVIGTVEKREKKNSSNPLLKGVKGYRKRTSFPDLPDARPPFRRGKAGLFGESPRVRAAHGNSCLPFLFSRHSEGLLRRKWVSARR